MPEKPAEYVPLCVQSNWSLLSGASTVSQIAKRVRSLGLCAVGVTDENNLYGLTPFLDAAREAGIRPIVGARVSEQGGRSAVLMPRDPLGYENLCRILTARKLSEGAGEPPFSLAESISQMSGGLTVMTEDAGLARSVSESVPKGLLWLMHVRPGRTIVFQRSLAAAASGMGIGLVATTAARFADSGGHGLHRLLVAINDNSLLAGLPQSRCAHAGAFLRSPPDMAKLFADSPASLRNTLAAAEGCRGMPPGGAYIFPAAPVAGGADASAHLLDLCRVGLARRFGPDPPAAARARMRAELDVIGRLGFPEYFVIVGEIVSFARSRGIPVVGRGSGASSMVAYLLGITNVDPLRHDLIFERFLHDRRADLPDLDVDICWRGRDEVIDHAYRTWGRDRVAMISTHNRFQARSAFRECAKAMGVPAARVDSLSKLVPAFTDSPLRAAIESSPRARRSIPPGEEPFASIIAAAERIQGFPRHLGIHCGGMVIGKKPVSHYVPVEWASKGILVTQFEMRAIERIGLVKFDLLGNRALTTLRECADRAAADLGVRVDVDSVDDRDPGAAAMVRSGATLGCFQLESPAMRHLLAQMRPDDLHGIIDALSLIRPGPASAGMKDAFVRRAHGLEAVPLMPPELEPVLGRRHGVMLYEEDVIACAAALTGCSLAEGDLLRRAIAKKKGDAGRMREDFIAAARARGVDGLCAAEAWSQMEKFSAYAFCRAHAAGYGVLAHRSLALKAMFPAQYACAVMNNHAGMYPARVHLEDARRLGVRILPPCVNMSQPGFVTEGADAVRVGLDRVRCLSARTKERILEARARRPFGSLCDFMSRVGAAFRESEALVLCGAFGFTGQTRPELLFRLRAAQGGRKPPRAGEGMFGDDLCPAPGVGLPEYDDWKMAMLEAQTLGLFVARHPLDVIRPLLPGSVARAADLPSHAGRSVRVAGMLSARRRAKTVRKREDMEFLTLEDETGLVECTLFPRAYSRFGGVCRSLGPWIVAGRVEERHGSFTLDAGRIEPLTPDPDLLT